MSESENIVWLEGAEASTKGIPVEDVLNWAKGECEEVVVIGYVKGKPNRLYAAASFAAHGAERTLWLMEQVKAWFIAGCPQFED